MKDHKLKGKPSNARLGDEELSAHLNGRITKSLKADVIRAAKVYGRRTGGNGKMWPFIRHSLEKAAKKELTGD